MQMHHKSVCGVAILNVHAFDKNVHIDLKASSISSVHWMFGGAALDVAGVSTAVSSARSFINFL